TCTVTASLSANVSSAQIFYRLNNEIEFTSAAMIDTGGGHWSHQFPPSQVTISGIQYYIMARSQTDSILLPEGAPDNLLAHVVVSDDDIPAFELEERVHAMCGMPARPDLTNMDLLFGALGDYGASRWRYWTTPYDNGSRKYVEHDAAARPEPGQGFWIVTGSSQNISFAGSSPPLDHPFDFPLEPGWNLIANPFAFPIPVGWIILPATADQVYHHYDSGLTETGSYTTVDTLQPGTGYFVWLGGTQSDNLSIDIVQRGSGKQASTNTLLAVPADGDFRWKVKIAARAGDRGDGSCIFGQREGATSSKDSYDLMKPPHPPGRYIHISLQDGDGYRLMSDWRGATAGGQTWTMLLASNLLDETCAIEFVYEGALPKGWRLVAIENGGLEAVDLLDAALTTRIESRAFIRNWRLVAGPEEYITAALSDAEHDFAREVTVLSLSTAWPNPFQSTIGTTISMSVPGNTTGDLQIFDVRGRLVRTLYSGKLKRGRESYVWYGKDTAGQRLASGVYFVRVSTPEARLVRKVMLVR
ncbi:MAG: FlgD immunoglobulin-like domain containing protein, partial [bacterium]